MKRFLKKSIVFIVPIILTFIIYLGQADGYTDPFYIRFTTPKQDNLILGTSRAAQGLQPNIFKKILKKDIYNYAFTVAHSPFGPTYLNSIKKKLSKKNQENIFIVTVDPWSISSTTKEPNDSLNFREIKLCLGNTPIVNMKPNYWYILNNLNDNFDKILNNQNSSMFLHENGWLEISIKMDSISVNQRINKKIEFYREQNLPKFKFSSLRLKYLKRTITFLNQYGKVFLVRLPVHEEMFKIEEKLMPDFDEKIKKIIPLTEGYLNMIPQNNNYEFTDGNHLYKASGKMVSKEIAEWIKKNQ
ncbi:hypothetical protein [Marinilabilia salmonicolor]|uniref:SGNH/GDSL hydrolase family protein n=1 Tax=Marinilabilia salmonicolor TaxID=989 RepID=A0A368UIS7_9BACT|nr:hypothetical protein [Marinilabilia salmonicolor]RCW20428.1 hypothetical protein DFO77_1622 [Marinilabilia salmonicolor]